MLWQCPAFDAAVRPCLALVFPGAPVFDPHSVALFVALFQLCGLASLSGGLLDTVDAVLLHILRKFHPTPLNAPLTAFTPF